MEVYKKRLFVASKDDEIVAMVMFKDHVFVATKKEVLYFPAEPKKKKKEKKDGKDR